MITNPIKKTKAIFSYLTLIYIGIFVSVIAFITYLDIKFSKPEIKQTPIEVPEINFLSSEEVSNEKQKLIPLSETPILTQEENSEQVFSETISDEQISSVSTENTSFELPKTYLISEGTTVREESTDNDNFVYIRQNSGINVTTAQTDVNMESKITSFTLEGSIYSKAEKEIVIVSKDGTGFGKITISPKTNILINGKNITISDLKVSDVIRAEGTGSFESKTMVAKSVNVIGVTQIIPIN